MASLAVWALYVQWITSRLSVIRQERSFVGVQSSRKSSFARLRLPFAIAAASAELGEKDQAFKWFNTALQEHDEGLVGLKTDYRVEPHPFRPTV